MRKDRLGLTSRELCPEFAPRWYALAVRHRHERQTAAALQYKNLETLVPVYRTRRRWSDRMKELELPLFSGYVFCRFFYQERVQVLDTPGVARIVGFGESPMPVGDREIADIRAVMESKRRVCPWPYLKPGDRVRLTGERKHIAFRQHQ